MRPDGAALDDQGAPGEGEDRDEGGQPAPEIDRQRRHLRRRRPPGDDRPRPAQRDEEQDGEGRRPSGQGGFDPREEGGAGHGRDFIVPGRPRR